MHKETNEECGMLYPATRPRIYTQSIPRLAHLPLFRFNQSGKAPRKLLPSKDRPIFTFAPATVATVVGGAVTNRHHRQLWVVDSEPVVLLLLFIPVRPQVQQLAIGGHSPPVNSVAMSWSCEPASPTRQEDGVRGWMDGLSRGHSGAETGEMTKNSRDFASDSGRHP